MAMKEHDAFSMSGGLAILIGLVLLIGGPVWGFSQVPSHQLAPAPYHGVAFACFVLGVIVLKGCFIVGPNEARVLTLFGKYAGTVKTTGPRWANPFTTKRRQSLRARNFETAKIKVNDIGVSLRGQSDQVSAQLSTEIYARIHTAGVEVVDARIAHLAYAPEIAQAMLQRQQAGAIIAARTRIVEGAVSMVEMAREQLAKRGIVELDSERKAAMVSNLLVVLCGERSTQPVVNAGTLY